MNAELISIGTEILLGEITDTNATWLARQLRDNGINLFYITAVGDNPARITQTLQTALARSDLVITTGGLGPTVDDMTRQAVAAATERELEFKPELYAEIARRFEQFGVAMTENNRQQAFVPQGAIVVENAVGTAPCFIVEGDAVSGRGTVLCLPGVPREMKYLMEHRILPYLREKMGLPAIIKARLLHTAGIGESAVDDQIKDFMTYSNPTVGLAAHSGQTDIRITARADSELEADHLIAELESQIRARLGHVIFGADQDSLPEVLAAFLRSRNLRVMIGEAGTGGAVGRYLAQHYGGIEELIIESPLETPAALRQHFALPEASTPNLSALAGAAAASLCAVYQVEVALVVLHDPDTQNSAFAIQTPRKNHSRELNLGSDAEIARWSANWGLGYIWRYLNGV